MSIQVDREKTFIATAAVTAFRRVKLTASSGTAVEHAGAGEACIGVSQNTAAIGEQVTVRMIRPHATHKVVAGGPIVLGAAIYGAADGAVDDAVSGTAQGTALEVATASGDIIEVAFDNGSAAVTAPAAIAVETTAIAVPFLVRKVCAFNGTPDAIAVWTATRKVRIVDMWLKAIDATAANITVKNATVAVAAAIAKGTGVDALVRAASLVAAAQEIASGAAVTVESSVASADIELFLLVIPIA